MVRIVEEPFGRLPDGREVPIYRIRVTGGLTAAVTPYGATLVSLITRDRDRRLSDLVLGHDRLEGYLEDEAYMGCVVGRYANRIRGGRFTLNGDEHRLACNDGPNHLHGGPGGFHRQLWEAEPIRRTQCAGLRLRRRSPDGEEGYPGNLEVEVVYLLSPGGELRIEGWATTDRPTVVNLTHHPYWNLAGHGSGEMLDQQLEIWSERFIPVGPDLIPTGEVRSVAGTPFDFRKPASVGGRLDQEDPQLAAARGYDHSYLLEGPPGVLRMAARLREPRSGRTLEIQTDQPGLQLYTGAKLAGMRGKRGACYGPHTGLCLEPQWIPGALNRPEFNAPVLRPGAVYRWLVQYRFGVDWNPTEQEA